MKALEAILDDGERVTMQPTIIFEIISTLHESLRKKKIHANRCRKNWKQHQVSLKWQNKSDKTHDESK